MQKATPQLRRSLEYIQSKEKRFLKKFMIKLKNAFKVDGMVAASVLPQPLTIQVRTFSPSLKNEASFLTVHSPKLAGIRKTVKCKLQ